MKCVGTLKWHMNYILKVEVFNCFVVSASFCTFPESGLSQFSKESRIKCVCVFVCMCVRECGALYEAVILSILAALKQSDNPDVVNPRTAAQAVSAHTLLAHRDTLCHTGTAH